MKKKSNNQSNNIIENLEQTIKDYEEEINLFKETIKNGKDPLNSKDVLKPDEIFPLVGTLYRLPINGQKIREQVKSLTISENNLSFKREVFVELPSKANSSTIMKQFKNIISKK